MEEQKNRREMETQQPWRSLRFSFRSATIIVCFLNLIAALLLLQGFLSSASTRKFSTPRPDTGMPLIGENEQWAVIHCLVQQLLSRLSCVNAWVQAKVRSITSYTTRTRTPETGPCTITCLIFWTAVQLNYIKESEEMRRAMEPLELIKRVREITQEAYVEAEIVQPKDTKQTAAEDLSKRLKDSRSFSDAASQKANILAFKLDVNPGDLSIETVAPRNWTYEQAHQ
ncbi:hypothetical protein CK203_112082 [Vitis vinifera]|uniref:Uncharacterized protein n=1 Tax=Vitis vinifera TaxID=29760 RepID=A0A438CEX2_VITVI|nr:hypothetical protein CK203_112082 [Vitis vinifera]